MARLRAVPSGRIEQWQGSNWPTYTAASASLGALNVLIAADVHASRLFPKGERDGEATSKR